MLGFFQQAEELLQVRRIVDIRNAIEHFRNLRSYAQLEAMDGWWEGGKLGVVLDLWGDYSRTLGLLGDEAFVEGLRGEASEFGYSCGSREYFQT
jgi:hypothetical protein